jgi:hypothetical protein
LNSSIRRKLETQRKCSLRERLRSDDEQTRRLALLEQELEIARDDADRVRRSWGSNSSAFATAQTRRKNAEAAFERAKSKLALRTTDPAMP